MLSINKVMITGRLTRDPETKYLPSGQALTNLAIAVNRSFKDKNGEWRDEAMFIDIETWGKTAEKCAETLKKGQPVYVEGRLKQDSWERDGVKQTKIRISADTVKGFEAPSRGQSADMGGGDEEGDSGGYSGGGGGGRSSSPAGGGQQARRGPAPTGAPSDNLDFDSGPGVRDDIPF